MPIEIDSADDPRVADYLGLRDRGDAADTLDFFIAESELVISRLVTSKFKAKSFFFSPSRYERLKDTVEATRMPVYVANREVMTAIAGFDVHRGALASVKRRRNPTLHDVLELTRGTMGNIGSLSADDEVALVEYLRSL